MADVRRPVYEGSRMVRAVWFDRALHGEAEARRRLLALWEAGARAYRLHDGNLHDGYLLEWRQPRRLVCERLPGLALCDDGGVLASAPLLAHERAGSAPDTAVLVFGASAHAYALGAAERIDPSTWLDLSHVALCAPLDLLSAAPAGFVSSMPAAEPDVRAVLGPAVPRPSAEHTAFLRQVEHVRERRGGSGGGGGGKAAQRGMAAAAGALGAAGALAAGVAGGIAQLLALPLRRLAGGDNMASPTASNRGAQPSPAGKWLADRLARLALVTRVSRMFGWRQGRYLRKMLRQFEQGDLGEALRHAISLDSLTPPDRNGFGLPRRRAHLDIGKRGATAAIGLGDDGLQLLRATYQRSFDMLDRAGRVDEAVFVLAELLNRHQEAVDYLERKGRIAQAAQLAETLALPPAAVVRLHCMAGNVERAVVLARLTGAFGDAVAELERRGHAEAPGLRLEWAEDLARRGNLVEAAVAVWPLEHERGRARAWLHTAEQAGGALGLQGLLYKVALDPASLRTNSDALRDLLHAPGEQAARRRALACDTLLKLDSRHAALLRITADLWRRLVADGAAGTHVVARERLKRLLTLASDAALADDVPSKVLPQPAASISLDQRAAPLHVTFAERGLLALEDVRILPDGAYLLALGEGGVAVARGDSKDVVRFPVPAHHLVLSHNGRHALALARREKVLRISRIDLVQRKATDWFSAGLQFWADDYDGATWNVVAEDRLMALDTAAPRQSVLWQIADLPGQIVAFDQQGEYMALLLARSGTMEQWRYTLPQRRLLQRDGFALAPDLLTLADAHHDQPVSMEVRLSEDGGTAGTLLLPSRAGGKEVKIAVPSLASFQASAHGSHLLLRFDADDGWHGRLAGIDGRLLADVVLPAAQGARARIDQGHVLAWDRLGRVVDVAIVTGAVRTETFG